jgi:hypothetical protein
MHRPAQEATPDKKKSSKKSTDHPHHRTNVSYWHQFVRSTLLSESGNRYLKVVVDLELS